LLFFSAPFAAFLRELCGLAPGEKERNRKRTQRRRKEREAKQETLPAKVIPNGLSLNAGHN
jgi:hypothetical protein